jgi:glucose-6-phosphate isomerase
MRPFTLTLDAAARRIPACDRVLQRRLSDLRGRFLDAAAYEKALEAGDPVVYEVHEILRPENAGELLSGLSVVHPGLVGDEYFMTMGHYHEVRETAEIYLCVSGRGAMVMENEEGDWAVEELTPGRVLYVAPGWAHRSVNLSLTEDFATFFVYPGHAGHDYGAIRTLGFRKLLVRRGGTHQIIDNPKWAPAPAPVGGGAR